MLGEKHLSHLRPSTVARTPAPGSVEASRAAGTAMPASSAAVSTAAARGWRAPVPRRSYNSPALLPLFTPVLPCLPTYVYVTNSATSRCAPFSAHNAPQGVAHGLAAVPPSTGASTLISGALGFGIQGSGVAEVPKWVNHSSSHTCFRAGGQAQQVVGRHAGRGRVRGREREAPGRQRARLVKDDCVHLRGVRISLNLLPVAQHKPCLAVMTPFCDAADCACMRASSAPDVSPPQTVKSTFGSGVKGLGFARMRTCATRSSTSPPRSSSTPGCVFSVFRVAYLGFWVTSRVRARLRNALQHVPAAQQQPAARAHGRRDQHGSRRGQAERARAGYDEHVDGQLCAQQQRGVPRAGRRDRVERLREQGRPCAGAPRHTPCQPSSPGIVMWDIIHRRA